MCVRHSIWIRSTTAAACAAALFSGAVPAPAQQPSDAQEGPASQQVVPVVRVAEPSPRPRAVSREAAAHHRYQIRVMEGVLESAVQHGAQVVTMQMRPASPDLMVFTGPARARGYRLDGYGAFFSVDVPAVRRSLSWSYRALNQSGLELGRALQALRRAVQTQGDARTKSELEQALRLVELQVGPVSPPPGSVPVTERATASGMLMAPDDEGPRDPDAAYEQEVKSALVNAMLDYGGPLEIAGDEWLTVAARDNGDRMFTNELADTVTIVLRIRGSDLSAYRAGRLSRDEARQRVEVREF
jgi:hypothetical protein